MLLDFDKIFGEPELQDTIPEGYINYLNRSAPPDTHYERMGKDSCVLVGDDGKKVTLGGFVFEPTEKQKRALGENFSEEDFKYYLYNSQTQYKFSLAESGQVIINGEKRPINQLSIYMNKSIDYSESYIFIIPSPMDMSFDMCVSVDTVKQSLHMVRKPNDSVSEALFESDDSDALKLSMRANLRDTSRKVKYTVKIGHPKTVSETIETIKLYNAFATGNACIDGRKLNGVNKTSEGRIFSESEILFWNKVRSIEERLDVHFVPPVADVSMEEAVTVERLYQSLIKINPTKTGKRIDSLTGKGVHEIMEISEKSVGQPIFMEITRVEECDLFGEHLELLGLVSICNAVLSGYTAEGDSITVKFADKSESEKLFTTILLFNREEELIKYRNGDAVERIQQAHNAKEPIEYL
ncbi:MAG: abortive infection system toxin AbiGii family protein [Oscillospiraceae bacterium]|nr:abortive infection system toxin AbiGii family protein [Oscillospiraceae bacterium]